MFYLAFCSNLEEGKLLDPENPREVTMGVV